VYNIAAFEIKKEIPIQIGLVLWGGGGIAVQRRGRAEATLPEARRKRYSSPHASIWLALA
jgi:hypothetical protein